MIDTTVLYHANCADGFGAALACWQHFQWHADYIPVSYGQPLPNIPSYHGHILIVDFSYDAETLVRLHMKHGKVSVFDHHASAKNDLIQLCVNKYADAGLRVLFDLTESGATLTWKALREKIGHEESEMPLLFHYIRDRDLWQWRLPQSQAVSMALRSEDRTFERWDELARQLEDEGYFAQFALTGESILRYSNQLVEEQAARHRTAIIGGHRVPIVNTTTLFSEVGDFLCQPGRDADPDPNFAAYYYDRSDGKRQWGLRARNSSVDVSVIAKGYGGGGHPGAAGFVTARTWEGDADELARE